MTKKKLLILLGFVLVIIAGTLVWYFGFNNKSNGDALKFKEEYEALNGSSAYGEYNYQELEIKEDNKVKYANLSEVVDILENGTGLIYIGFPNCPWCRGLLPSLLDTVDCSCLGELIYLNASDIRDTYELKNGVPTKTKDASDDYYKLLELLDEYLLDYTLTDENGENVNVGEKRLYVPMVIAVKNGIVMDAHVDSVELDEGQTAFDKLTDTQNQELNTIFNDMIDSITKQQNVCENHC